MCVGVSLDVAPADDDCGCACFLAPNAQQLHTPHHPTSSSHTTQPTTAAPTMTDCSVLVLVLLEFTLELLLLLPLHDEQEPCGLPNECQLERSNIPTIHHHHHCHPYPHFMCSLFGISLELLF